MTGRSNRPAPWWLWIGIWSGLLLHAYGHTLPISFLTLVPDADYLHLELTFNPFELTFAAEIDANRNGRLDATEWATEQRRVAEELMRCLTVEVDGRRISAEIAGVTPDLDSHHASLRAHYRVDVRHRGVRVTSHLSRITSGSHLTQVTFNDGSEPQRAATGRNRPLPSSGKAPAAPAQSERLAPPRLWRRAALFWAGISGVRFILAVCLLPLSQTARRRQRPAGVSGDLRMKRTLFCPAETGRGLGLILAALTAAAQLSNQAIADVVWSIGKPDGFSIEFAPGTRSGLTYIVGESTPSRDFAGHQAGSIGFDGTKEEKPYTVVFDLPGAAAPSYSLLIDLIYKSGAPSQIKLQVNEHTGIFPIRHAYKKSGDGEEGNVMLMAQQRLNVPLNPAWLKPTDNHITIVPLGLGGLDYDAIQLVTPGAPWPEAFRLEPTIFYRNSNGHLMEVCELIVPFQNRIEKGRAIVGLGSGKISHSFSSGPYDFGILNEMIAVPADEAVSSASIEATLDGLTVSTNQSFRAAKRWKLFVCPKVHNDVGYTDLQPHVNELDNRNTDQALAIMDRFPFYKFNFETGWLVDNFLDCRTPGSQQRFFEYAKRNRATINVLYLNLMTGLCTGEELYRAMYFTERLHRERGSSFDFACLTDAPSHTWFLPSLLQDVGVRCFSNGSNQSRAPILHHSDLNENSPFWWEGMNGERIFMWYARSYTQWKRLTGPDFTDRSANYDYLKTSIPQFLTQFLRAQYLPDAVMIYGAYVDNAAIPDTGEAELIERWNKEFEFPKLVCASDAEYFQYIEKNFGGQLPVYRGDCGAYWEDGVGSTAAATRLNRRSQQILPAAETAAALATLFTPINRYPHEDFRGAWRNVMFYNEHTWGAHNSVSQPGREFVERQWEIKESYATRANLDARNLLARAFNRLCQQIDVSGDTILAFNWQNYPRTEPLEVEIGAGQGLLNLETGKAVDLDTISERDGWKRVRFLADNVAAFGYKGYAIRSRDESSSKGQGERTVEDTIESRFYKLTVDPGTGGIKSLVDKAENRELLDPKAPYHLNEYLYVSGGEGSRIYLAPLPVDGGPAPRWQGQRISKRLGARIVVQSKAKNTPVIRSDYLIYDSIKRVDVVNTVEKVSTRAKEGVYFALILFAAAQLRL
ncbi:MAG: polysaccharide lyase family protein [Verrucomicrobiota bacterium]